MTAVEITAIDEIQNAANHSGDQSLSLLELVFGSVVRHPLAGLGSGNDNSNSMVAHMFMVVTGCMLAIGVILAMYHCVSGMIATAQSGEFLGERKSSAWYVIRTATGFLLLMPVFGGYCGAQIIMLWGALMGIGIANLTLDSALSVIKGGGSMIATPPSPQATTLAKALFEANLCAESANGAIANLPNDIGIAVDPAERFNAITTSNKNKIVLVNARGLSCGGAEINVTQPPANSNFSQLLFAHQSALADMQSMLSVQARRYVQAINYHFSPPDALSIIDQAARQYEAKIRQAIRDASNTLNDLSNGIEANLKRDGWIMMGAWYQRFAQANTQIATMANATAGGVPATALDLIPYPQLYRKIITAYLQQYQRSASTASTSTTSTTQEQNLAARLYLSTQIIDPKHLLSKIFGSQQIMPIAIAMDLNNGEHAASLRNPLIGMKNFGEHILNAGGSALNAYAGWKAYTAKGVLNALGPFIVMLIIQLFLLGALLSIYIPILPFLIWVGGVISWFVVVGEAIIASPFWAMTHLADDEGDWKGLSLRERSTYGYIFFLNLLFRPVLMVIGFVLAGIAVNVFGALLNTLFSVAMQNAQWTSATGLVSMVGFIVLYVSLCQTLCNLSFSLIHIVPDHVFAWVGGQIAVYPHAAVVGTGTRRLQ